MRITVDKSLLAEVKESLGEAAAPGPSMDFDGEEETVRLGFRTDLEAAGAAAVLVARQIPFSVDQ